MQALNTYIRDIRLALNESILFIKPLAVGSNSWLRAFLCAPSGARFQQVQVLNPPGSGKDIAEGKGVHREVESGGSWMWGTY